MEKLLKKHNLKITKGRVEILKLLSKCNNAISADEVYSKIPHSSCRSIATVYRILNQLADLGILRKTLQQNGICYYEMHTHSHKHYIVCTKCGEIEPISECPMEPFEKEVSSTTGYKVTGHSIELKGICPKCQDIK
ncbi:Fur family transcriptional regulator [Peptoniphilus mikwangii]|uniref:Fur family transcriptional regulator n=1 Tax=Peptoniphilus mikwangii TaxID=1354300 RepID=UPI0003FB0911|nr:Fur family transcriptional regulator [Peptoniphilus mikwangii]